MSEKELKNSTEREVTEIEGFGVTYDRSVMAIQQRLLVKKYALKMIIESPSYGAKAAGSLYSLGYAVSGCNVTLVNPETDVIHYWEELGLRDRVRFIEKADYIRLPFEDNTFDLAWNFVTFTNLDDQPAWLNEMKRVTNKYVMVISCNNFQLGYPLHRIIHKIWNFPWNHGKTHFNLIWNVKKFFKNAGLKILEYGAIDTPPWPDPVGFRDVRLHKHSSPEKRAKVVWDVPFVNYLKSNTFPLWMRALSSYDIPLRHGYTKLPFSHLFYVLAKKQ
jgi:Methyltransferase domain